MRRAVLLSVAIGVLATGDTVSAETRRYTYTGAEQTFVVPPAVTAVTVTAVGGRGGSGRTGFFSTFAPPGGFGGVARASLAVTPGQTLFVEVGGNGGVATALPGVGGFNGGGLGGAGGGDPVYNNGGGGGGASDVRTSSRTDPAGGTRLVIAAGGGGGGMGIVDGGGAGGAAGAPGADGVMVYASPPCTLAQGGGAAGPTGPAGANGPGEAGAAATVPAGPYAAGSGTPGGVGVGGVGGAQYDVGGAGGGGGGGLYGGGGGGGGTGIYPGNSANCTPAGGGGGLSGFAAAATGRSVGVDGSGVPSVTFTYTPAGAGPPALTSLSLSNRKFRVGRRPRGGSRRIRSGTSFRFNLSEAAKVTFTIERRTTGRRAGGRCRPKTRANRRARRCTRYTRVGSFTKQLAAGSQRVAWSGRLRKRALRRGRYRASVQARDAGGLLSVPSRIAFTVVR
jgi:hypothetical protein